MAKRIEISIGTQYGSWTVLAEAGRKNQLRAMHVQCVCGSKTIVALGDLRQGKSTRCRSCQVAAKNLTHGGAIRGRQEPEYEVWQGIKKRCLDIAALAYPNYGGRGIAVCDRWLGLQGYTNFRTDMGPRPSSKHTIERVDNDDGYNPENCCWATRDQQANNKRNNRLVTIDGTTKTLKQWSDLSTLGYTAIKSRLNRGWSARDAVFAPRKATRAKYPFSDLNIGASIDVLLEATNAHNVCSSAWSHGKRHNRTYTCTYLGPRGQPTAVRIRRTA